MIVTTIITEVQTSGSQPASTLAIILFWVVLAACIAAFFYFLRKTDRIIDEDAKNNKSETIKPESKTLSTHDVQEEEAAAIALAISIYKSQMHDMDSFTITLRKVSRIYSPWSSKIYTLRQNPRYNY